jgi:hypothetical protein
VSISFIKRNSTALQRLDHVVVLSGQPGRRGTIERPPISLQIRREVVLQDGETETRGKIIAESLMFEFGIDKQELIPDAYLDLIGQLR